MEAVAFALAGITLVFILATGRRRWVRARDEAGTTYWLDVKEVEGIEPLDETHARLEVLSQQTETSKRGGPSPLERTLGRVLISAVLAAGALYILALADNPTAAAENCASGAVGAITAYWLRD